MSSEAVAPRPASTILLLRDSAAGEIEVFMMVRHYEIDFNSGALVFPGGSVDKGDQEIIQDPELYSGGEGLEASALSFRIAAIRETFEESGILLALNELVPYAHWITPEGVPKRFDTWFFLAAAPPEQVGAHDGKESTNSIWLSPREALAGGESGRFKLPFPTTRNLIRLGKQPDVRAALDDAGSRPIVTVMPVVTKVNGSRQLRIPLEAGYDGELFEINAS